MMTGSLDTRAVAGAGGLAIPPDATDGPGLLAAEAGGDADTTMTGSLDTRAVAGGAAAVAAPSSRPTPQALPARRDRQREGLSEPGPGLREAKPAAWSVSWRRLVGPLRRIPLRQGFARRFAR